MPKNYYLILGVASNASEEEIKAAFRRRAKELHPDSSGHDSEAFIEAQEAYGVLSDPERRRRYDQDKQAVVRRRPWGPAAEAFAEAPWSSHRPFTEVTPASRLEEFGIDLMGAEFHPSFEEFFDRLWGHYEGGPRPKGERVENLMVKAVLHPFEARHGGRIRVTVPGRATCKTCGGGGAVGPYECWHCGGHGALAGEYPLDIPFPPGTREGHVIRVSLAPYGIENFHLTLLLRVADEL